VPKAYSTRFLDTYTVNAYVRTWVPAGRRAVIMHVSASNFGAAGDAAVLIAHGISVWRYAFQGVNVTQTHDCRIVVNEGEAIEVYLAGSSMSAYVGGYLFEQSSAFDELGAIVQPVDLGHLVTDEERAA
jgi:hypothetical protein